MHDMKKIGVFVKPTESLCVPLEHIVKVLSSQGYEVLLEERAAQTLEGRMAFKGHARRALGELCDAAVVLGGDGTILGVAREIAGCECPLIGVNAGRLGFITDVVLEDVDTVLPAMLRGECSSDRRHLLEGVVLRNGKEICRNSAVNDIGFSHGRAGGMVGFIIYVDGRQMSSQSADGIICSTSTGSTAYALAAGGPILHPSLEAVQLVPVAPHTLSNRPIVLPANLKIEIELVSARDAVAYFDMQEFCDVIPGDVLRIEQSSRTIEILHPLNYDYFELLRRKLKWNFSPASVHRKGSADSAQ